MDAVTHVPAPVNEPVLDYAPGSPERVALEVALAEMGAERHELPHTIGGERVMGKGERIEVAPAARPPQGARRHPRRHRGRRRVGHRRRDGRRAGLARPHLRRPGRHPPQGGRPARRAVARPGQRRDHARPVQDRVPGRDRRRVRAHRLLAVQRPLRPADHGGAAARQLPRAVEPQRPPPARGLRLRGHAVQLHRDRRQPAHRARADGQHRRVEARRTPSSSRPS